MQQNYVNAMQHNYISMWLTYVDTQTINYVDMHEIILLTCDLHKSHIEINESQVNINMWHAC